MPALPTSDVAILADLIESLRRRSKALKHAFAQVSCQKVAVERDDWSGERLDIELLTFGRLNPVRITLRLWEDRWAWVDLREGGRQGWRWTWSAEGRLAGAATGRELVAALEQSKRQTPPDNEPFDPSGLDHLWRPMLLTGPVGLAL